ncbi:serine/threonine protein kinase [Rhodobium gokarnense]|uniref:Serine/threonine protein kinase n=1 Tax=Rhodobium gokarnense TaxID=364296 RepID=A0ABT3H830_9HYPH|nr:serine/threonine-protein kinase [Rhodobium gokarnense]MCW2306555.1 serine/threonine protein kinase [Rhodobium gokarnense]
MAISEQHALAPGAVLGDYTIHGVLGQGGFGITYDAENTTLRQHVAIKEFLPSSIAFRDATQTVMIQSQEYDEIFRWGLDRFLEEARILANLTHPNIVRVLNFMRAHGTGYMIMDHVDGETLGDWAERYGGGVPQAALTALTRPLLDALATIHAKGITHRDIKPDNILIAADGRPVLIDFGAARNTVAGKSQTMAAIVSPGFSPYEQYSTSTNQGPYTDVYSLAAVLYRLILCEDPPEAPLRVESTLSGAADPCVQLATAGLSGYDPAFLAAVDWALNIRPGDRPQSIAEWRASFDDDGAGTDENENLAPPPRPAATTEFYTDDEDETGPFPDQDVPASAERNRKPALVALVIAVVLLAAAAAGYFLTRQPAAVDAAGDSVETARDLGVLGTEPLSFADAVGGGDPADVYGFRLSEPADVRLVVDPADRLSGLSLQDETGEARRLIKAGDGLVAELDAGTHYLTIAQDAGEVPYEFELSAAFFQGKERPGRNINGAADLGTLTAGGTDSVTRQGSIPAYREDHYYTLRTGAASVLELRVERRSGAGELVLYDDARNLVRRLDSKDDVAAVARERLAPGRYTVRLQRTSDGPYDYTLSLAVSAPPRAAEPAPPTVRYRVDEGASFETARLLPDLTTEPIRPSLEVPAEAAVRYLAFSLTERAAVQVAASSPRLVRFALFEKATARRLAGKEIDGGDLDEAIDLGAGDYVMMLDLSSGEAGSLVVTLSADPIQETVQPPGALESRPAEFGSLDDRFTRAPLIFEPDRDVAHFVFGLGELARVSLEVAETAPVDAEHRFEASLRREGGSVEKTIVLGGGRGSVLLDAGQYVARLRLVGDTAETLAVSFGLSRTIPAGAQTAPEPIEITAPASVARDRQVVGGGATREIPVSLGPDLDLAIALSSASEDLDLLLRDRDGTTVGASRLSGVADEDLRLAASDRTRRFTLIIRNNGSWPSDYDLAVAARAVARPEPEPSAEEEAAPGKGGDDEKQPADRSRETARVAPTPALPPAPPPRPSRFEATGGAIKSDDLATDEAVRMAARAQARAGAIEAAAETGEPASAPISTYDQWAEALTAIRHGIPHGEAWTAGRTGDGAATASLDAGVRLFDAEPLIEAKLLEDRITVRDPIRFTATAGDVAVSLGVFAWFENETVVRLYPRSGTSRIDLAAGETMTFPPPGDPAIMSAPAPGSQSNFEAIVLVACRDRTDFRTFAPTAGQTSTSSLVQAISGSSFFETLSTACETGMSVVMLPYVISAR